MIVIKLGKRIHRVAVSLDSETFDIASHLANYDGRTLSEFLARIIQQDIHGRKLTLPRETEEGTHSRCDEV